MSRPRRWTTGCSPPGAISIASSKNRCRGGVFVPWGTCHCERSDPFAAKGAISTDIRRGLPPRVLVAVLRAQNALAMTEGGGCSKLQTLAAGGFQVASGAIFAYNKRYLDPWPTPEDENETPSCHCHHHCHSPGLCDRGAWGWENGYVAGRISGRRKGLPTREAFVVLLDSDVPVWRHEGRQGV
jgi:hypothetical protein